MSDYSTKKLRMDSTMTASKHFSSASELLFFSFWTQECHCVAQSVLKVLGSINSPALASQVVGTAVSIKTELIN